jgi:Zn-dependent protease with chaperone function
MKLTRQVILIALLTALIAGAGACAYAADKPPFSEEFEKKIGAEAAAQVEKEYKLYEDEEAHARLVAMVSEITAASSRPDVVYDVRLLDTEDVNAFSLPGGIVYVTKGLLEEAGSDHEIAGVLAHEIAHNCTYDALRQAEKNEEMFTTNIAALITGILLGADSDMVSTIMIAGEYVRRGILGGYSIKMETAADEHAMEYIMGTSYNPVGLVTFMERLAAEYRRKPQLELGFLQTHPDSPDRVVALKELLLHAGVDLNRRAATEWEKPLAEEVESNGSSYAHVTLRGIEIVRMLNAGPAHDTPLARAEEAAGRLTEVMQAGLQRFQVRVGESAGNPALIGDGTVIFVVYPEDAQALGVEQRAVAQSARVAVLEAMHKEQLERLMGTIDRPTEAAPEAPVPETEAGG